MWLASMLVILVLLLATPQQRSQKLRVWIVMVAGLPAAFIYSSVWAYLAIDLIIAALVMTRPKTTWQRAIGLCYVSMGLLTTGYIIRDMVGVHIFSSAANSPEMLQTASSVIGWIATAILFSWGASNVWGHYRAGNRASGHMVAAASGRV